MWAGGRFEFHHPLRIGDPITRHSRIMDIKHKQGRTGELVFVLVRHEISNPQGLALTEEHDIVFRDVSASAAPPPAPTDATWQREIHPDDVLLFRYSALTFNSPPHPLRPPLHHRSRRLPRPSSPRPPNRNATARSPPPLAPRRAREPFRVPRRKPALRHRPLHRLRQIQPTMGPNRHRRPSHASKNK